MKGLYHVRKRLGITQAELGEMTGIDSNTISRYEREQLNATNSTTLKIAEALGVSVDDLLNGPSDEKWELKIKIMNTREEVIEMMSGMPCISAISLTPEGGMFEVSGNKDVWRDSEKYEDLKRQMDKARETILEAGQKVWGV